MLQQCNCRTFSYCNTFNITTLVANQTYLMMGFHYFSTSVNSMKSLSIIITPGAICTFFQFLLETSWYNSSTLMNVLSLISFPLPQHGCVLWIYDKFSLCRLKWFHHLTLFWNSSNGFISDPFYSFLKTIYLKLLIKYSQILLMINMLGFLLKGVLF
jgi:hypothetical protein